MAGRSEIGMKVDRSEKKTDRKVGRNRKADRKVGNNNFGRTQSVHHIRCCNLNFNQDTPRQMLNRCAPY